MGVKSVIGGGPIHMSAASPSVNDSRIFGTEWRIQWLEDGFYILHHHTDNTKGAWLTCSLEDENDKRKINYVCRDESCNAKVPPGIVTAALTKKLHEARQ